MLKLCNYCCIIFVGHMQGNISIYYTNIKHFGPVQHADFHCSLQQSKAMVKSCAITSHILHLVCFLFPIQAKVLLNLDNYRHEHSQIWYNLTVTCSFKYQYKDKTVVVSVCIDTHTHTHTQGVCDFFYYLCICS